MSGNNKIKSVFVYAIAILALVVGMAVVASPSVSAFARCEPGRSCDAQGQQCNYFPSGGQGCYTGLTCQSYNSTQTVTVPYSEACFCFQNLQVTKIEDLSLSGNGATGYFKIILRQSQVTKYRTETQNITQYFFDTGGELTCPQCNNCGTPTPTCLPTPTPCPTCNKICGVDAANVPQVCKDKVAQKGCGNWCVNPGASIDYCYFDVANNRVQILQDYKTCIDPPVSCDMYISGPGLDKTYIGKQDFNALPNFEYEGVARINQSYFQNPGVYSLDVNCNIALPQDTSECTPGCSGGSARINFHTQTCDTSIGVQTDKSSYSSGEMMTISGSVTNNNVPALGNVILRLIDSQGRTAATMTTTSNGGQFTTNYLLPTSLAAGTYTVEAEGKYSSCDSVTANVTIGFVPCDLTLAADITHSGSASSVVVSGNLFNKGLPVSGANITAKIYSGGDLVRQVVGGTLSDGSYNLNVPPIAAGTYTAQVEARYMTCSAVQQTRSIDAPCDIHASISLASGNYTAGQAVVATGSITDSYGNLVLGTYDVQLRQSQTGLVVAHATAVTQSGYVYVIFWGVAPGNYDILVTASSGSCSATAGAGTITPITVRNDYDVSLYSSPACGSTQKGYQFKIKNNLGVSTTVTISYSSVPQIRLQGPTSVYLRANEEQIIYVDTVIADGFSGGSIGAIYFTNGNTAATLNVEVPICAEGNIKLTAIDKIQTGSTGQVVCYKAMLENLGPDSGTVTLSYNSGRYAIDGYYNFPQLHISSYETRDDLLFCATVPNVQFSSMPITLKADAPFGSSSDSVSLTTPGSNLDVRFTGCPYVARGSQFPISVYNNGDTADYTVEVIDNGYLHALPVPATIYHFNHYTSQTVALTFNPTGLMAANYVTLLLRRDGAVVDQQQLCFSTVPMPTCTSGCCSGNCNPTPTPAPTGCKYGNPACLSGYYCDTTLNACKAKVYASSLTVINRSVLGGLDQPIVGPGLPTATNTSKLNVVAYAPILTYGYDGQNFTANASFLVQNNEDTGQTFEVSALLLPAGWTLEYAPKSQYLNAGEIKEFVVRINAADFERKTYAGVLSVSDTTGRIAQSAFNVDATNVQQGNGTLTGFFTGTTGGILAAGIVLVAIGGILLYGIRKNSEVIAQNGA